MRIICALFGHRWHVPTGLRSFDPITCDRCNVRLLGGGGE